MEGLTPDRMVRKGFFECPEEVLLTENQALSGDIGSGAKVVRLSVAILPCPAAVLSREPDLENLREEAPRPPLPGYGSSC